MPTSEFALSPAPLFSTAQEINRRLNSVAVHSQGLAAEVRRQLIELGQINVIGVLATMDSIFTEARHQIEQRILEVHGESAKEELTSLFTLIRRFEQLFLTASPDWRRGVTFGIIHNLTEPLAPMSPTPPTPVTRAHPKVIQFDTKRLVAKPTFNPRPHPEFMSVP